jgi:hypothetical protein
VVEPSPPSVRALPGEKKLHHFSSVVEERDIGHDRQWSAECGTKSPLNLMPHLGPQRTSGCRRIW